MKILYLPLEFPNWFSAKKLTYPVGVGLYEGFKDNNIDFIVVPSIYNSPLWVEYLDQIIAGQKIDQVWFEVVHSFFSEGMLKYIKTIAPIRVGFIIESLTIHPDEYKSNQKGTQRRIDNLNMKLPIMTHAVVTDARDQKTLGIPTSWEIATVPTKYIANSVPSSEEPKFIFYGTNYGERAEWLIKLGDKIIVNPQGNKEEQTGLPAIYEELFRAASLNMRNKLSIPVGYYKKFCDEYLYVRSRLYHNWMSILSETEGTVVVNPPHRTQVMSSRVVESMAAGKMVVSPRMNNPADFLFIDGVEIYLYDSMEHLESIINDFAREDIERIAKAGFNAVKRYFNTKAMVERIIKLTRSK